MLTQLNELYQCFVQKRQRLLLLHILLPNATANDDAKTVFFIIK